MTPELLSPIGGRAAWTGAELARDPSWIMQLPAAAAREIDSALAGLGDRAPPRFDARDFPLPETAGFLAQVAEELEHGRGLVRLTGLDPARYSLPDLKRVFWGLMCHLGTPLPQNTTGEILAEVKDETGTGAAVASGTARARSRSTGPLRWHTDKCDLLTLLCASNGIEGGVSRIVSTVAVQDAMAARRPDLLAVLYQDFWRARSADEEGEGMAARPFPMPVFARGPKGDFTSQYSRTYVELAQGQPSVPPLRPEQVEAMDLLAAIADELCIEMPFEPGQIQLMNQHVTYHGRTAYADGAGGKRNLLRIWLASPLSRALPAGHADQWGDVRAGALRGGAMPGKSALAA
ncbi:TauD/TfdA family dioxygenase [Paracraurococcus lichenis]|uniref:TauD/TfdA family dioxygenase n=1 Tax=Paracraurococcus lichenis TaxID=3064888 RepID=A0ABT9DZC5_9PROT|nr:TauD/TfdA family dioxygenase [Paracraurococcus sp. LOR1-02]MDO9709244.1 TauD/TfdA family dioxygenase [Paracraurococcus sp. LOR1-02]